ncbi:uncharacterized protein LOC134805888 [Cydia splendana]|uniref:uncharacterized protein LOC134805888 n=1 Tax=Cydia splendana TaxID=1100963 RepID=UPI00300CC8A1
MSARHYLAWDMLAKAAYEDERREQGKYQADMRKILRNPLQHISENNFIKEYRLSKEAFEDLCDLLINHADLKSTQRVSVESKLSINSIKVLTFIFVLNKKYSYFTGDSGYPQRPWLMTPYLNPTPNSIEENFNAAHTSARVVIENTFGRLKNRWRCVHRDRNLHYRPEKCSQIIIACSVLHNIALKYNVPDPEEICEQDQEFHREEVVLENGGASDLLMGRALRDQLARRLASRRS